MDVHILYNNLVSIVFIHTHRHVIYHATMISILSLDTENSSLALIKYGWFESNVAFLIIVVSVDLYLRMCLFILIN